MTTTAQSEKQIHHLKWPSFPNVHKMIKENGIPDTDVLALEKVDGSNLGLEVDPVSGTLVALHGRNCLLWSCQNDETGEDPFDRRYGSVRGTLHSLQQYLASLIKLTRTLGCRTVIFGEWYRDPTAKQEANPVWLPFGLKTQEEGSFYQTMTLSLYQTFLDHNLTPPKIMFQGGTLEDAVNKLFPLMLEPECVHFEGVFFTRAHVSGTRYSAKWKTGPHEEQPSFVLAGFDHHPIVQKLYQVYDTKKPGSTKKTVKKSPSKKKMINHELEKQVTLALHSVLSKSSVSLDDLQATDRDAKRDHVKRIHAEVMTDVMEQYESVGNEVPKEVKKICGKLVSSKIMKSNRWLRIAA